MQHINILIERILHKFLMEEVESVPTFLIKCGKLRVSLQLIEISNTMSFSLEYIYPLFQDATREIEFPSVQL